MSQTNTSVASASGAPEMDFDNSDVVAPSSVLHNSPGDILRTVIDDAPVMKTPSDTCYCRTCRYRYPDPYGYRNGNCGKYKKDSGKPNDILFKGAKCAYYRIDRSEKQT